MAEDRPLEDPAQAIGRIDNALRDLESTMLARLSKRPTGDFEMTLRTTPKPGTLFCDGTTVDRVANAALWAWAQAQGLVVAGLFTVGNGSTTFGLPDFRGCVVRGKAAVEAIGATTGADTKAIATANLPSHDHNVSGSGSTGADTHSHSGSTGGGGGHGHSGSTGGGGNHGGHSPMGSTAGGQFAAPDGQTYSDGDHSHAVSINAVGDHSHTYSTPNDTHSHTVSVSITESLVGSGAAFDVRQLGKAVNFLVWS